MSAPASSRPPLKAVLARWDAVVIRWGLDPVERSLLIGGFADGPVDDVETYRIVCGEERMRLIVEFAPVLARVYADEEAARAWLRTPGAHLSGRTPLEVMAVSSEWMRWLIDNMGVAS